MENRTSSINWLAMGSDLIQCLKSKGNHRLTRYDAFVWIMEHIKKGVVVKDDYGNAVSVKPYSASYKRLAEEWNWEWHTVQSFIQELTSIAVITTKRQGNVYAFYIGKKSYKQMLL
jgi:transcriptional regulator with PAS, ATPase and Fis domain